MTIRKNNETFLHVQLSIQTKTVTYAVFTPDPIPNSGAHVRNDY